MPTVKYALTLAGAGPNEAVPSLAVYALVDGKPPQKIATADGAGSGGSISFDPAKLKGMTLGIGPDADPATIDAASLMRVRADQVLDQWARSGIVIPRERWWQLLTETICVSGDVRKCRPWYLAPPYIKARPLPAKLGVQVRPDVASALDLSAASIVLPFRCLPICDGVVEVYERVCCCPTIDWGDLINRLRDLLSHLPILVQWPVPPIPDPGPLHPGDIAGGIAGGIGPMPGPLARPMLASLPNIANLRRLAPRLAPRPAPSLPPAPDLASTIPSERIYEDYQALLKIRPADVAAFVDKRPYLSAYLCHCSSRKVGEVAIQPSGQFDLCYRRPRQLHSLRQRCYTTFAYKVRQKIGGMWVTVYDGLAGNDYFSAGEVAHLSTSHPAAQPCGDGPTPPDGGDGTAFVMLEHVGGAGTHHFNFPAQTGLSNMAGLAPNSGLIDFAGVPDCPWATGLGLRLWSSPALDGIVVFYRFKAVPINAAGDPAGPAITLDGPVSWQRYVTVAGQIVTTPTSLAVAPADVGGEVGLYRMPYWSGGMDWLSGQYHQIWDTRAPGFPDGKYMLLLELFGPGGARIKPASAAAGDPGTAKPFQFRRWTTPTVTANVPFADCGHVFWINNRPVTGDIVDLRKNGVASGDECQFMSGPGSTTVSIGFRAFHQDGVTTGGGPGDTDSFMAGYALTWQRGLNGPGGTIETGTADQGELATEASNALAFSTLLGAFPPWYAAQQRCTFSVHLHVDAKHTNGGAFIDAYDYDETASFALEMN